MAVVSASFRPTLASAQTVSRSLPALDRVAAESCVGDVAAPITLYGAVPSNGLVTTVQSMVEIYPGSDLTTAYLAQLENSVNGIMPTYSADQTNDPHFVSRELERDRAFASMPQIAKSAPIIHTGQFLCRGFYPGKYEFFATVHAFATTSNSAGSKSLVTQYYRASLDASQPRKSKATISVPAFHLIGQVPK